MLLSDLGRSFRAARSRSVPVPLEALLQHVAFPQEPATPAWPSQVAGFAPGRALYLAVKRLVDLVAAAVLLVVLCPVLLGIALVVWLDDGSPILFRTDRLGRYGRPIVVLKFRTMRDGSCARLEELLAADERLRVEYEANHKLRDDPRRTRVGGILRRTSLDELPQLWNVLRGEMSLIGPRPYLPEELVGRSEAAELLSVRPGISGLWQVNGRSERTFEERIALELDYVRRSGPVLDTAIALRTLGAVMSGRGACAAIGLAATGLPLT